MFTLRQPAMSRIRRILLLLSVLVISTELALLFHFWQQVTDWLSHHLWVVLLPLLKGLFKRAVAVKLVSLLKAVWILLWHLFKLLILLLLMANVLPNQFFITTNR